MEGKFYVWMLLIIGFVGGCYALFLSNDTEELRTQVLKVKLHSTSLQNQIDDVKSQLEQKREIATLIGTLAAKKSEHESLEKEVQAVMDAELTISTEMKQAVTRIRRQSVGMTFDELPLTVGTLKKAMIQKVNENDVVIQHSDGVKSAKAKDLPPLLKDRFRFGFLEDKEAIAAEASAKASAGAEASVNKQMTDFNEQQSKHEKKVLEATLLTEQMTKNLTVLKEQLSKAEEDFSSATSATSKYYTKARRDQLNTQVLTLQNQLMAAQTALTKLATEAPKPPSQ